MTAPSVCECCGQPLPSRRVTGRQIALAAADEFGFSADEMAGAGRHRRLARARQIAAHIMRRRTRLSLPQIGRVLHRDHATVIHAVQTIDSLLSTDPDLAGAYSRVLARLEGAA